MKNDVDKFLSKYYTIKKLTNKTYKNTWLNEKGEKWWQYVNT